jgi:hypothetical protein
MSSFLVVCLVVGVAQWGYVATQGDDCRWTGCEQNDWATKGECSPNKGHSRYSLMVRFHSLGVCRSAPIKQMETDYNYNHAD